LVALWREGLLAQQVLRGGTRGYTQHPQLIRFQHASNPQGAIARYLRYVADEADRRGYRFDRSRIAANTLRGTLQVTRGQLDYEFTHLLAKLNRRDPARHEQVCRTPIVQPHPLFTVIPGDVADWEIRLIAKA
jgi:hypothetical protein